MMSTIYTVKFEPCPPSEQGQRISISGDDGLTMEITPQQARAIACDLIKAAYQIEVRTRRVQPTMAQVPSTVALTGT